MILTAAFEFNKDMSPLLPSRPSDNMELSKIILSKTLPHVCAKSKERYIGMPYAIKARILLHSHLERVPLHSTLLELGESLVLHTVRAGSDSDLKAFAGLLSCHSEDA